MGILAWLILLFGAAAIASLWQMLLKRPANEWIILAGAALIGAFTAHLWYGVPYEVGPTLDGLYVLPALAGGLLLAAAVDILYRTLTHHPTAHPPRGA